MIIDADVHISPYRDSNQISYGEALRRMDSAGVDKAVIWLQPPVMREVAESNAYVYEATKAHPDRFLGFGWADPILGVEKAKDEAKKCIEEYGFYGVKLNGAQNGYYIDDPDLALPVIETIAALRTRLAFHIGADEYQYTHPYRAAKVARHYPEMPILMVHMGGASFKDVSKETVEFATECANMTLIGSAIKEIPILNAIHALGADRVCFGSDTPFGLMRVHVAKYRALLDGEISEEEAALVMGGNIARVFGLDS